MNKINLIIAVLVVFLTGILIGFQIENKIARELVSKANSIRLATDNYFYLANQLEKPEPRSLSFIERALGIDEMNFRFSNMKDNVSIQMGVATPLGLMSFDDRFIPIYAASPDPSVECFKANQIITQGSIQTIEDLNGKVIGVNAGYFDNHLISLDLRAMSNKKITASKLYIYDNLNYSLKKLMDGTVDALFYSLEVFSNNQFMSRMGSVNNGIYSDYPNLKILSTFTYKIPCKLIFVNKSLPPQVKEKLESRLVSIVSDARTRDELMKAIQVGSVKKVTSQDWEKMLATYKDAHGVKLETIAPEVIYEKSPPF